LFLFSAFSVPYHGARLPLCYSRQTAGCLAWRNGKGVGKSRGRQAARRRCARTYGCWLFALRGMRRQGGYACAIPYRACGDTLYSRVRAPRLWRHHCTFVRSAARLTRRCCPPYVLRARRRMPEPAGLHHARRCCSVGLDGGSLAAGQVCLCCISVRWLTAATAGAAGGRTGGRRAFSL
jgi:hypothetical protein